MNLHLSDEQAAALPGELDRIIESDPTRSRPGSARFKDPGDDRAVPGAELTGLSARVIKPLRARFRSSRVNRQRDRPRAREAISTTQSIAPRTESASQSGRSLVLRSSID